MKTALIIISSFIPFIRPCSNTTGDPKFNLNNVSENMLMVMQKNGENFKPNNSIKSELSKLYGGEVVPSKDGKYKNYSQIIADSKDDYEKLNEFIKEIEKMQVDDKSKETGSEKTYYNKFFIILKKIYCIPDDQDINIPMEMFEILGKKNSEEFKEFYNRERNTQIIVDFFNDPEFKKYIELYFEGGLSREYPSNEENLKEILKEKFEKVIRKDEFDFINEKIKCAHFYNRNFKKDEICILYNDEEKPELSKLLAKENFLEQNYSDVFERYDKNYSEYLKKFESKFPINNESQLESFKAFKFEKNEKIRNEIKNFDHLKEALLKKLNILGYLKDYKEIVKILNTYLDEKSSKNSESKIDFNLDNEIKLLLEYLFEKEFITGYEAVSGNKPASNKKWEELKEFVFIINTEKENYIKSEMKKYNDLYVSLKLIYDEGLKKKLEESSEPIESKDLEVIIANLEEDNEGKAKKMKIRNFADKKKFKDFVQMFLNSSDEVSKLVEKIKNVRGITPKDLAKNGLLLFKGNSDKTDNDSATNNKLGSKDDDKIDNSDDNNSSDDKKKSNENKGSSIKDKKKDNDDENKKKDNDDENKNKDSSSKDKKKDNDDENKKKDNDDEDKDSSSKDKKKDNDDENKNKDSSSKDKKKDNDDEDKNKDSSSKDKKKDNDKNEGWLYKIKNMNAFWAVVIISIIVVVVLGTILIIAFRKK